MSSLVEVEPYSLAVPEPGSPHGETGDARRETNLLQLAWQPKVYIEKTIIYGLKLDGYRVLLIIRRTPPKPCH